MDSYCFDDDSLLSDFGIAIFYIPLPGVWCAMLGAWWPMTELHGLIVDTSNSTYNFGHWSRIGVGLRIVSASHNHEGCHFKFIKVEMQGLWKAKWGDVRDKLRSKDMAYIWLFSFKKVLLTLGELGLLLRLMTNPSPVCLTFQRPSRNFRIAKIVWDLCHCHASSTSWKLILIKMDLG